MTAPEFCAGKGFEASSLRWAVSQLAREEGGGEALAMSGRSGASQKRAETVLASRAPRLVPVEVRRVAEPPGGDAEVLVEVGEVRIRVKRGADIALVGEVVRAVRGGSR